MKKNVLTIAACCFVALALSACGGGGGSAPPVPTTKVVLSAYLFGTMSSSTATVTTVHASMKVPSGVFADYSSPAPAGYPASTYPIRSRSIVASGGLSPSVATTSGTYNTATGTIELSILNNLTNNSIPSLKSSPTGNGTEFATLYFKLAVADSNVPFQPSNPSLTYDVLQTDLSSYTSGVRAKGCELRFNTTYQ